MIMSYRLEKLRQILVEEELDAILISQGENRRYLSGFTGSAGFLLISQDRAILTTDSRYVEQAQAEASTFEVIRIQGALSKWLPPLLSGLDIQRLGFEGRDVPFLTYRELTGVVGEVSGEISLVSIEEFVESLRAVKDQAELQCLEKAAAISDAALEEVLPGAQPGISERELAWELESFMRCNGSEPLRAIRTSEPVMIDLGANVGGYFSDITRTICLGEGDNTFHRIYDIVLGAQLTAMATLQVGMNGEQVDQLARTVIAQAGYEENFGHGLGHGVGLAAHEEPRLGSNSSSVLANGMVFTIEPGIYIPGWGGVRIEDTVALEEGRARPLTRAKKARR